ncbi:MAG: DUF2238 domain-containing protein [bacterium]|nr:DUF2238 domain-containing protein [bacterium]
MLKIARFTFGAWIFVEVLSWAKILPLTLEFTWLGLILTASLAWGALEVISWRLRKVGARNLWAWTFFATLISQCTDAFGDILRLYGTFSWYDQVAHLVGGAVVALILYDLFTALHEAQRIQLGQKFRGFVSILGSMAIGSLYELEEYGEDVIFGSNRLGSALDTGNDMLLNTIGAVCLILIIVWVRRRKQMQ